MINDVKYKDLVHVSDEMAGYSRKRWGKGFVYLTPSGKKITEHSTLKRIKELVIPPMWEDVWICQKKNGHLQVTGRDEKSKKQYIYHPAWSKHRNLNKFKKLKQFGVFLPLIRQAVDKDLDTTDWTKEKVIAVAVSLLDSAYLRVGNIYYKNNNNTYGLTTLRRKHLNAEKNKLLIEYKAKSNKERQVTIEDKKLIKHLVACSELPGYEVFRYKFNGSYRNLESADINQYLKNLTGRDFTAKDFRTWGGCVLTLAKYPETLKQLEDNPRKKLDTTLITNVAEALGNTVSVCKDYYIAPQVLNYVAKKGLPKIDLRKFKGEQKKYLSKEEKMLSTILR